MPKESEREKNIYVKSFYIFFINLNIPFVNTQSVAGCRGEERENKSLMRLAEHIEDEEK